MTTANKITIFRILLIPFFVAMVLYYGERGAELYRYLAVTSFLAAAICDGVDGFIARRFNQRSELGAVLDPLADKLLLVSGVVVLAWNNPHLDRLPLWFVALIIGRDVVLTLGLAMIYFTCGSARVRPHFTGKIATVFQMSAVTWILLKLWPSWLGPLIAAGGLFTAISGMIYIFEGIRQLSASPSSAATPGQGQNHPERTES